MMRKNLFDGDCDFAAFAQISYKLLMTREWVTYKSIMDICYPKDKKFTVSSGTGYGELKKAFPAVRKAIQEKLGNDCFEEEGNNRNKRFRYVASDDDPLADMRNAKVISDLKQYWQFCQDSAGFFPSSWLDYFFKDSRDLLDIKAKRRTGEQVLSASLDRMLANIDLLPYLYVAIKRKQVLSIVYKPYDEEERTLIFHPHYLKEFNGRWHLFGHADGQTPEFGYNIALDRICSKPQELYNMAYTSAPKEFYDNFFKYIVGVSHMKDISGKPYKVQPIRIRAHNNYIYRLIETKIIHPSQEVVINYGKHEDGEYGEFVVNVELNNEFIGRILQMGDGLEIVAPDEVRLIFKKRVLELAKRYEID